MQCWSKENERNFTVSAPQQSHIKNKNKKDLKKLKGGKRITKETGVIQEVNSNGDVSTKKKR